jgi:hypothetical protein
LTRDMVRDYFFTRLYAEFDFDGFGSIHAFEFDEVGIAPIDRESAPELKHNDVRGNVVVREKISSFLLWE